MGGDQSGQNFFEKYSSKGDAVYDMKMEHARLEHETEFLRDQLHRRECVQDQQKSLLEEQEREMEQMMKDHVRRQVREALGGGAVWGDSRNISLGDYHQYYRGYGGGSFGGGGYGEGGYGDHRDDWPRH